MLRDSKTRFSGMDRGILCFSPKVARRLAKKHGAQSSLFLGACFSSFPKQKTVIVSQFGVGAPASVIQLEYLIAGGLKTIYSLGLAGGFSDKLRVGEPVFIEEAYRDEGCSYHYKPPSLSIKNPHPDMYSGFIKQLSIKSCASWTTDAPYRETDVEFKKWKDKGLSCVEMEASALMAVGEFYSKPVFCLAVISDEIDQKLQWNKHFSSSLVEDTMVSVLEKLLFME